MTSLALTADEWYMRGRESSHLGLTDQALYCFTRAIEEDAEFAGAYLGRGVIRRYQGRIEEAASDQSPALKIDPTLTDALFNRALCYYDLKKFDLAISDYSIYVAENSEDGYAYYGRGLAFYRLKLFTSAITDFTAAIGLEGSMYDVFYARGLCYYELKQFERAINDFSQVIYLTPLSPNGYAARSFVLHADGKSDLAGEDEETVRKLVSEADDQYYSCFDRTIS